MTRVLIVEDEAVLRSSMARGIAKIPNCEVVDAGSVEDAIRLVDEAQPDLVFSDIDLPERSGLELLGELGKRDIRVPVVFVSAYLKAYRSQIPRHANVEVLEKPIGLDQLRRIVLQRTGGRSDRGNGETAPFSLVDYVQLACMGRHSVLLQAMREEKVVGRVFIVDGELWSAEDDEGDGVEAFCRIAFHASSSVECRTLSESPGARNITDSWEHVLMEGARLTDEASVQLEATPEQARAQINDGFDEVVERGVAALLERRYEEALERFEEARRVRPDDGRVEANILRLHQMGFGTEGNE